MVAFIFFGFLSWNTLFHSWLDASAFGIGYTISESNKIWIYHPTFHVIVEIPLVPPPFCCPPFPPFVTLVPRAILFPKKVLRLNPQSTLISNFAFVVNNQFQQRETP